MFSSSSVVSLTADYYRFPPSPEEKRIFQRNYQMSINFNTQILMLKHFLIPLRVLHLHAEACFICGIKEITQIKFCDD